MDARPSDCFAATPGAILLLLFLEVPLRPAEDIGRISASPGGVAGYVNQSGRSDLTSLWRSLNLSQGNFSCGSNSPAPCTATIQVLNASTGSDHYSIVRLQVSQFDPPFRYLLYSRSATAGGWRLRGSIDFTEEDTDNSYPPVPSIRYLGQKQWLVFEYPKVCRGTGVSGTQRQWFEMGDSHLTRMFVIHTQGRDFAGTVSDPAWDWQEELLGIERRGNTETLRTRVTVRFFKSCFGGGRPMAVTTAEAVFTRTPGSEFRFDTRLSDVTANGLIELTQFPKDRNSAFLEHNFDALRRIAERSSERDRRWLLRFLSRCKESPEKIELRKVLSTARKSI